ncbi:MAG TPA: Fe-S cluster assembly protein NifU [Candidatus Gastranaerophilales bacterium]|nr:Fe-S cluster assembly protein NifU [Candidatus Gastranaerophilales bacterium]
MWEYTEKVKEHYKNPKNVGIIEDADAIGEVGSITCGDALKLFLKIDKNGIITDAKFQTFGCGSAVASASILTEMLIGKTVLEAEEISNQDIADMLGGLPEQKMHCSVMGREALEAAISNFKGEPKEKKIKGKIICGCFGVTEDKIREVVQDNQLNYIEEITNYTKAGGGCGKCKDDLRKILAEEISKRNNGKKDKPLTKTQQILKVNNILETYVAPELRKDGGDIELVDIEENKIYVNLQGACKNCPSSNLTLKNFVENILKEHIGENIEVIEA